MKFFDNINENNLGFINVPNNNQLEYKDFKLKGKLTEVVKSGFRKLKKYTSTGNELNRLSPVQNKESGSVNVSRYDKKNSIICLVVFVLVYFGLYLLIDKWRRAKERRSVEEAAKQYERDKRDYIETGVTR